VSAPWPGRDPAAGPAGWARAAALVGLAATLWSVGHEALPPPPLHRPSGLGPWAGELGPAGVAMAVVRVGAVAVAALLGLATVLHLLARSRGAALGVLADRLVPATARPLVHGLAGISLTAGASVGGAWSTPAAGPAASTVEVQGATVHHLPTTIEAMRRLPGGPVEWMRVAPGEAGTGVLRSLDTGTADTDDEPPRPAVLRTLDEPDTWRVEAGDSFWSIATEVVADARGRPPTDAEVAPYWADLVEANRDRLVTGDPDLVYPGQDLRLPPVEA
jgi:nucleoid-associated protein YgaU